MDIIPDHNEESDKKLNTDLSTKRIEDISFFELNEDFSVIYKKTEKLASAIYIVTNHFSENEPIKWVTRKKVTDLLSFIINYKDVTESTKANFIHELKTKVLELVSSLEISSSAGLISQMNFSILKQEFLNLINMLVISKSVPKNPFHDNILQTYFDTPPTNSGLGNDGNIYNITGIRGAIQKMSFNDIKDKNDTSEQSGIKRTNRQNTIIGILKKKKDVTINDLAQVIRDCSEKTIQRELNYFISTGILKRVGVRRWSRYSLV